MKCKYSLLGLAAGTALLVATGCSKQESPGTASADSVTKAPAPAAASAQRVETSKPTDKPAAVAAKPAAAVASTPAAMTPPPATTNPAPTVTAPTNAAATQAAKAAAVIAAASNSVAAALGTNATLASALQSAVKAQQVSFAQGVSNQLQTLAATGTNQVLSALATTNQVPTATTNQVQQLLERAKTLCANQKYQDALSNLTQLYTTKLTPEQKQKADELKAQVQAGLAQKATSALGNFLNGTK